MNVFYTPLTHTSNHVGNETVGKIFKTASLDQLFRLFLASKLVLLINDQGPHRAEVSISSTLPIEPVTVLYLSWKRKSDNRTNPKLRMHLRVLYSNWKSTCTSFTRSHLSIFILVVLSDIDEDSTLVFVNCNVSILTQKYAVYIVSSYHIGKYLNLVSCI